MANGFFPALEARTALPAFYQYQQNQRQNQLVDVESQRQQLLAQEQQNRLAQQQRAEAERQQFNTLIPGLLGLSPLETPAAANAVQGVANGAPPQQASPQGSQVDPSTLVRAFQLNPGMTEKFLDMRAERAAAFRKQQVDQATESVREAQFVLASKNPKALMSAYFPDRVQQIQQGGHDWESMSDDDVRSLAQHILERAAPQAGLDPTKLAGEGFTLSEGQKRFDAHGNVIASVDKAPSADDKNQPFKNANTLRDEFNTQSKDFYAITRAYQNIQTAAAKPSAAGDLSLIFGYMRILDPGSTVREGEFANAENAGGIPARIRARYNKVLNGERLDDTQRNDFVTQAGNLFEGQKKVQGKLRQRYSDLAKRAQIDPLDVVGPEDTAAPANAPRKSVGGKNYVQVGGQWYEDDGT